MYLLSTLESCPKNCIFLPFPGDDELTESETTYCTIYIAKKISGIRISRHAIFQVGMTT